MSKFKVWVPAEIAYVKANEDALTVYEIAKNLGRTRGSVRSLKRRLKQPFIGKASQPWTKQDDYLLMELSERFTPYEIAKKLARTEFAIRRRMTTKGIKVLNGGCSLWQFCRRTGYHQSHVFRARENLKQNWRVAVSAKRKRYFIVEEQQEDIIEYLKTDPGRRKPPETLFWRRITKSDEPDGCWLWSGNMVFKWVLDDGRVRYLSPARLAWRLTKGEPKESGRLRRTCSTDTCVNPDHHTFPVSRKKHH